MKNWVMAGVLTLTLPLFAAACNDDDDDGDSVIDEAATQAGNAATAVGTAVDEAGSAVAGVGQPSPTATASGTATAGQELEFDLDELDGSGYSGKVTLTDAGGGTTDVVIEFDGPDDDTTAHPAHIHLGTCDTLDPNPEFPLTDVMDGRSETTVSVDLATLQGQDYAVNVHQSMAEIGTYIACGDIPSSD